MKNTTIIAWIALGLSVIALALSITQMILGGATATGSRFQFQSTGDSLGGCFIAGEKIAENITKAECNAMGGVYITDIKIGN